MTQHSVTVLGGGLAGCAAALVAARRGAAVSLVEQRPARATPLHTGESLCELVGSPDLGAIAPDRATGLLKAELRELAPALLECADEARTGNQSLTVDRELFARLVTERVEAEGRVEVARQEARALPEGVVVVATGPSTWSPLARAIHEASGRPFRFSFMGRAPIVAADRADLSGAVREPPYPGADPALFVPLSEEQAVELARRVAEGDRDEPAELSGDTVLADEAEPVERQAGEPKAFAGRVLGGPRGPEATIPGPALRLAPDDRDDRACHVAEFVTSLTPAAQAEALRAVSALARVEIARPGVVCRLPWLPGGAVLLPTMQLHRTPRLLVAGTLTGGAGYVEALATGAVAGLNAARIAQGAQADVPPAECLTGALCRALAGEPFADGRMIKVNFGMLPDRPEDEGKPKDERRERQIEEAMVAVREFAAEGYGPI